MKSEHAIDGSDATIYPELSRANLLRMRGDYRGAEEQCLAILKRYPNNATVHTLLGDIYAEQDDLEQAAQWYELALDLDPTSTVDEQKLANVRDRMRLKETAASAEQLGLPTSKSNVPMLALAAVAVIVLVTIAAYMIGQRSEASASRAPTISKPIEAPSTTTDDGAGASTANVIAASGPKVPQVDRELVAVIAQRSAVAGNLVSILSDPRNHIVTVTYSVGQNEDEKRIGAELARAVLEQSQDTLIVTVRAVRGDEIVYMADAPRSRYQDLDTTGTSGDAWITHLMTNEWPAAKAVQSSGSDASPTTPPAGSGTTNPPPGSSPSPANGGGSSTTPSTTPPPGTESGTGTGPAFSPPLMGGR